MNASVSPSSSRPLASLALRLPARVVAASALLFAFAGCSLLPKPAPDPTRHYVLTGPSPESVNAGLARGTLKVGVRTVSVAPYLDGKAMIVRRGDNEIDYREYARWAEPLSTGVGRMLQSRLLTSQRVARVFPQPFPFDVVRDVDVSVALLRCEGEIKPDGSAVVSFLCAVEVVRAQEARGGGEVLLRETFVAPPTPWVEGDHAGLARALSEAVAQLADRVASALPAE
jgi:uncharacterized lipoprotein YmbA